MIYRQPIYHDFMRHYLDRSLLHGNVETLILALLAEAPSHGYQLRWTLADRSHHYFQLAFGRLYPLLKDLERRRLVSGRDVLVGKSRMRRVYAITATGRRELARRRDLWYQFAQHMNLVLRAAPQTDCR